jgi:hypothetical protein
MSGRARSCRTSPVRAAVQGVIAAPIGLNVMVLAVWLIFKGFNLSTLGAVPEEEPNVA